jgi:hypothetical protein
MRSDVRLAYVSLLAPLLVIAVAGAPARGAKLYSLDGEFRVPLRCELPVDMTFNVHKGTDDVKGTATATFDGASLSDVTCDERACITSAFVDNGDLVIVWTANGWKGRGEFGSTTTFEWLVSGCDTFSLEQHTSCSEIVYLHLLYLADPMGMVTYTSGDGDCLDEMPSPVASATWAGVKAIYR